MPNHAFHFVHHSLILRCDDINDQALLDQNLGKTVYECLGSSALAIERSKCNKIVAQNSILSLDPNILPEEAGITVRPGYFVLEVHTENTKMISDIKVSVTLKTQITG